MQKLKNRGIILFLLLVILLVILLGNYFYMKNRFVMLDVNSGLVQNLYQSVVPNKNIYILKQLYNENGLSNEYKLNMGIMNLVNNGNTGILNAEDVENSIKNILGDSIDVTHQTIQFMLGDYCGYTYNEQEKKYIPFDGCGNSPNEFIYQKLLSAAENKDKILLKEQIIYFTLDRTTHDVNIYNNVKSEKLIDNIQNFDGEFTELDLDNYIQKGAIYEYEFIKEKGNYFFTGIRKIE